MRGAKLVPFTCKLPTAGYSPHVSKLYVNAETDEFWKDVAVKYILSHNAASADEVTAFTNTVVGAYEANRRDRSAVVEKEAKSE